MTVIARHALVERLAGQGVVDAHPLPRPFPDSTNTLWRLRRAADTDWLLHLRRAEGLDQPFWRGMEWLFGTTALPAPERLEARYNLAASGSPLRVPGYLGPLGELAGHAHWITEWLEGGPATASHANAARLGTHLGRLHAHAAPAGPLRGWGERLADTLDHLAERDWPGHPGLADRLAAARTAARALPDPQPAWILPDIRWDQFLERGGRLDALVDVEALVIGPAELDLAALEYQLDAAQAEAFAAAYRRHRPLPGLAPGREACRLLLFLMGILGERDLAAWMAAPVRFR